MHEDFETTRDASGASCPDPNIDGADATDGSGNPGNPVVPARAAAPHGSCGNCQAALLGAFCHACGQSAHIHRSLLHLGEEVLHGILHFDANGWRTLPLLVMAPGRLTRRYIDGQRKKYVSPLALFLFMVFLSFFAASFSTSKAPDGLLEAVGQEPTATLADAKEDVARARQALEAARKGDGDVGEAEQELENARLALVAAQAAAAPPSAASAPPPSGAVNALSKVASKATSKAASAAASTAASAAASTAASTAESTAASTAESTAASTAGQASQNKQQARAVGQNGAGPHARHNIGEAGVSGYWQHAMAHANVKTGSPALDQRIKVIQSNPDLALYKLKSTLYKFSFMLVPISLPFLWLMFFWKRGVTMYDHAVFVLYSLSFMSLLFVTVVLLSLSGLDNSLALAIFVPPLHMFAQLRQTYGLGFFATLWRTALLLAAAVIVTLVYILFVLSMTAR